MVLEPFLRNRGVLADIGASDGFSSSNSRWLLERGGWTGELWEPDPVKVASLHTRSLRLPGVVVRERAFQPEDAAGLPRLDFLSLDIDGNDYWVLRAILMCQQPDVIICEVHNQLPPPLSLVMPFNPRHQGDGTGFYGMSLCAALTLLHAFSYRVRAFLGDNLVMSLDLYDNGKPDPFALWEAVRHAYPERIVDGWLKGCPVGEREERLLTRFDRREWKRVPSQW